MSIVNFVMDPMIKMMPRKKREEMMVGMMPLMMEGIDMNKLMPRMMTTILEDITADDIVNYLAETLKDREKLKELGAKIQEANLAQQVIIRTDTSVLSFDDTVSTLAESARRNGWQIDTGDPGQQPNEGQADMTKWTVLYFGNPPGEHRFLNGSERNKAMSVMMPMGVSVYETTDGQVEIAAMNLSLVSNFFSGVARYVLKDGGERYEKSLEGIVRKIVAKSARKNGSDGVVIAQTDV